MALEDQNALTIERLEELLDSVEAGDLDTAVTLVDQMEERGVRAEDLAEVRVALTDDDPAAVEDWVYEQLTFIAENEGDPPRGPAAEHLDVEESTSFDLQSEGEEAIAEPPEDSHSFDLGSEGGASADEFSFDLDDAFGDLEEDIERALADDSSHPIPIAETTSEASKGERGFGGESSRGRVLTGRFEIANPSEVLAAKSSAADDGSAAGADSTGRIDEEPFDSGKSGARYTAEEPPPPSHRADASDDVSGTPAIAGGKPSRDPERRRPVASREINDRTPLPDGTDDMGVGFDLDSDSGGLLRAERGGETVQPWKAREDDEFSFDLGSSVASDDSGEMEFDLDFFGSELSAGNSSSSGRDRVSTPQASPALEKQNSFFDLADDSSVGEQYRGEPIGAQSGAFDNNAPTGTDISALEAARSVVAGDSEADNGLNGLLTEARRLRSIGELHAARDITKKILSSGDAPEARELNEEIESDLADRHLERLGSLEQTPKLDVEMTQLAEFDLDHRTGFIVSMIDGMSTYDDLIEVSGMSRFEALSLLVELWEKGIISAAG